MLRFPNRHAPWLTARCLFSNSLSEAVSKPRLTPGGCVVLRFEMLAYWRVRSAFKPQDALPSGVIQGFENASVIF